MPAPNSIARLRIVIRGAVQGVGFRPLVFRLASEMGLPGWVSNTSQGVFIEVEGDPQTLTSFLVRIEKEKPLHAFIQSLESSSLDPVGFQGFEIRESSDAGEKIVLILPDIATCPECLKEIFDVSNRRYLYPFTNCTNCGPRFSIIESLPYDRENTSMKRFPMCPRCRDEYEDPRDRRFHAQPNACPVCGPHIELWDPRGKRMAIHREALIQVGKLLLAGKIAAVKGVGGFHLMVDARNEAAVKELRTRKRREEKPFALMYPSLEAVKSECMVSELEERLLGSVEAPIVLLERNAKTTTPLAASIAPHNPLLGIMLPSNPLHVLLMRQLKTPVVATSGNLTDEPLCIDEQEALERLKGIADVFLVHNRPIVRHIDDSIVRVMAGREMMLRRARGFAPLPVPLGAALESPVLAVGAHLKNTVALASRGNAFISQHIGDLETRESIEAFHRVVNDFRALYNTEPATVACDLHPDYLSTQCAKETGLPTLSVQHHYAHVASCMAENELTGSVLGISWDGTGLGTDGTIWGGEFLLTTSDSFERVATFKPFPLPGGEQAIKEPRRTAIGLLHEIYGDSLYELRHIAPVAAFPRPTLTLIRQMLEKEFNCPLTSSVGRLFDAIASMTGVRHQVHFEGQAAMELEHLLTGTEEEGSYEFLISDMQMPFLVDWTPMIFEILTDLERGIPPARISARFHNTLTEIVLSIARRVNEERVALTGGCFQNRYLTERTITALREEGFSPYWHQRVPPNDGGISLGQLAAVGRQHASSTQLQEPEEVTS